MSIEARIKASFAAVSVVALAACNAPGNGNGDGLDNAGQSSEAVVAEGSLQADGLLTFLNSAAATEAVLDLKVRLDRRAAANIASHVAGADKLRGTADDQPFKTVAELDALPYVGPSALTKLVAYVTAQGLVPDQLVEGVPLFNAQVTAILEVANQASVQQLDLGARLDSRAASGIVAKRPLSSITELAAVKYVGQVAIERLRDYAPQFVPLPAACQIVLGDVADADADNMTRLIAMAYADAPTFAITALQITGCADALDAGKQAALVTALEANVSWGYTPGTQLPLSDGGFTAGGADYLSDLDAARDVVNERVNEGQWDPASTPGGATLYPQINSLMSDLSSAPKQTPSDFVEVTMTLSADECSQRAVALINIHTLAVRIIHKLSLC